MQASMKSSYGDVRAANMNFEQTLARIEAALKEEGFGVLCQIDIKAKLEEKLGIEFPKYVILGACNPPLANRALQEDINLGLLLPCNAVVYERDGKVFVGVVDAEKMLSITDHPEMEGTAREVNQKLRRALDSAVSH